MSAFPAAPTVNQATISAIPLRCPAWWTLDLTPLWRPATMVGEDIRSGSTTGNLPRQKRYAGSRRVVLDMVFSTTHRRAGTAITLTAPLEGWEVNLEDFTTNILEPLTTVGGTRPCIVTKPSGAEVSGGVHPLELDPVDVKPTLVRCTFELSIPAGVLTA